MSEDNSRKFILGILLILIISSFYVSQFSKKEKIILDKSREIASEKLLALLSGPTEEEPIDLGKKSKESDCVLGTLPDRKCSPGKVPLAAQRKIAEN